MGRRAALIALGLSLLAGACSSSKDAKEAVSTTATANGTGGTVTATTGEFVALHPAEGYGLLRLMTLEERPNPLDVVIYKGLPNELSRIAGVITTVAQTPLSHVNLRAIQDNVPNAYIADALENPAVTELIGRYVHYTVTTEGFTIVAATQAEVEAHHAAARPATGQTPQRDLSVRTIAGLDSIGFEDWTAYGVKAANVATLRTFNLTEAEIPNGYAVPFFFYDEFMKANGFYDQVRDLLADDKFRNDPAVQDRELEKLRDAIKDASMPSTLMEQLATMQRSFPAGTAIRCRSSTNNEDLPNFNGAGLYDSKTQHPDEGHIAKCIKQVYASVWNLRAFLERDFYRIDHLATAMGVLVIPSYANEKANGVAVSIDPLYETPDAYYVNTQLGEDLVTNPEALSVPEAILLLADGSAGFISHSNLIEPGTDLLSLEQRKALRATLATIHERFAVLYDAKAGTPFAMEIEFKITAEGKLAVKQARSWVFN